MVGWGGGEVEAAVQALRQVVVLKLLQAADIPQHQCSTSCAVSHCVNPGWLFNQFRAVGSAVAIQFTQDTVRRGLHNVPLEHEPENVGTGSPVGLIPPVGAGVTAQVAGA